MHIADVYGTFCALAGVDPFDSVAAKAGLPPVDSLDFWPLLSGTNTTAPREEILVTASALVTKQYKLLTGNQAGASWSGPQYPNATTASSPVYGVTIDCGSTGCLFDLEADMTEHTDLAASLPGVAEKLNARRKELALGIFTRPKVPDDPACMEAAFTKWGGFLGPWRKDN